MDEILRLDIDKAIVILRGKNVLEVNKFDYSKHPDAKWLRASKASSHIPAWRTAQEEKEVAQQEMPKQPSAPRAKRSPKKPTSKPQVITATKDSILSKPEKEETSNHAKKEN